MKGRQLRPARPEDRNRILSLLTEGNLPTDVLSSPIAELWIMEENGRTLAMGGFEFYGIDALLRSVAVDQKERGAGVGTNLVDELLGVAYRRGVGTVWLLTESARDFFVRKGFSVVQRTEISNDQLKSSPEFTHVCATTAVCMRRSLV